MAKKKNATRQMLFNGKLVNVIRETGQYMKAEVNGQKFNAPSRLFSEPEPVKIPNVILGKVIKSL